MADNMVYVSSIKNKIVKISMEEYRKRLKIILKHPKFKRKVKMLINSSY